MDLSSDSFASYKPSGRIWITLSTANYYPDYLTDAVALYSPVFEIFQRLLMTSESSERLFMQISEIRESWMRIQLARVFRKYVSPSLPVEMLKKKTKAADICAEFSGEFRAVHEVQSAFITRTLADETLSALLWEYKDRGKKGYDLTERFFAMFHSHFPTLIIKGPQRAGQDIPMGTVFSDYPNLRRPIDFVIYDEDAITVLAVGLARYDSDRGGAQEDDRTGGYASCADEVLSYTSSHSLSTKVIFLNDGPGLLLGSMWDDYAKLESRWPGKIKVFTLRMIPERLTIDWLRS